MQAPVISAEAIKVSDGEEEEHFLDVDRV